MQIHTDHLTSSDLYDAARTAGSWLFRQNEKGSRTRARKFDVIVSGSSTRQMNFGLGEQAATWDEWGIFLNVLYQRDPLAHSYAYAGLEHFRRLTHWRFDNLKLADQCPNHNWKFVQACMHDCVKCGATRTWEPKRPVVVKGDILHDIRAIERFLEAR